MKFEKEIKEALRKAGLSESLADQIKVRRIEDIDGAVERMRIKEAVSKAAEDAGVADDLDTYIQSMIDRRVTDAINTREANIRKEIEAELEAGQKKRQDGGNGDKTEPVDGLDNDGKRTDEKGNPELTELRQMVKTLSEKLEGVTTKLTQEQMDSKVKAKLKEAGLSEEFYPYVRVEDDGKIDDAVSAFREKMEKHQQGVIDKKIESGELAGVAQRKTSETALESQIEDYAKSIGENGAVRNVDIPGVLSAGQKQE